MQTDVNRAILEYRISGETVIDPMNDVSRSSTFKWPYMRGNEVITRRLTPNFKTFVRSGRLLPELPYTRSLTTYSADWFGTMERWKRTRFYYVPNYMYMAEKYTGVVAGYISSYVMMDLNSKIETEANLLNVADSRAITKLLNQVKDSKANLALSYAESRRTHQLIADNAKKLANVLISLRKGNLSNAAEVLGLVVSKRKNSRYRYRIGEATTESQITKCLSDGVLTLQYGIKPLLSDIIGAAELAAQKVSREEVGYVSVSGNASQTIDEFGAIMDAGNAYQRPRLVGVQNVKVRYTARFGLGSEVNHTLSQMGLTNPLNLAWELLPWSFVIDWFIPIGNYLNTLDATNGLAFISGSRSVKVTKDFTSSVDISPKDAFIFEMGAVSRFDRKKSFDRAVLTEWPVARLPSFKNPVSLEHAINAVALLIGLKSRLSKP